MIEQDFSIKNIIIYSFVWTLVGIVTYHYYLSITGNITGLLSGKTTDSQKYIRIKSPEIQSGGGSLTRNSGIHTDIYQLEGEGKRRRMEKEVKSITENITVKERTLILITAVSRGLLEKNNSSGPDRLFGHMLTRILIDGVSHGQDSASMNGAYELCLFSTVSIMNILEPGRHRIEAEGLFYGGLKNADVQMETSVMKFKDIVVPYHNREQSAGEAPIESAALPASPPPGVIPNSPVSIKTQKK